MIKRSVFALVLASLCGSATRAAVPVAPNATAIVRASEASPRPPEPTRMSVGRFGDVTVYRPVGTPTSVVLFLSGDGGWHLGVVSMARALVAEGAIVAGLNVRNYRAALGRASSGCVSLAGDFEALSHRLQKELGVRDYLLPVLVGYSSGATIVYATLAQSPAGTFAGALSLGFCPDEDMKGAPLCPAPSLEYQKNQRGDFVFAPAPRLQDGWIALQGQQDQVCDPRQVDEFAAATGQAEVVRLPLVGHGFGVERNWLPQFIAAFHRLAARAEPKIVESPAVRDLPLTEVAAAAVSGPGTPGDRLALLLTGDGGWAGLDQEVSALLAARGVPVVGFNTLKYFWRARTPEESAADVTRVLRHYLDAWNKDKVIVVGYSFGADVLPAILNRIPAELRARIIGLNLIAVSESATFEVHVADWLPGVSSRGLPVAPELARLRDIPTSCFYGAGEKDALCPTLDAVHAIQVGAGHHLGGRYEEIVDRILAGH
jgi:type IV secretory pathway VirJ component